MIKLTFCSSNQISLTREPATRQNNEHPFNHHLVLNLGCVLYILEGLKSFKISIALASRISILLINETVVHVVILHFHAPLAHLAV